MIDIKEHEELSRLDHSCAHVMAQAVKCLYPQAKFWVGPVISEGFYYNVDLGDEVIKEEGLAKIEKEMKKIVKDDKRTARREISKEEALEMFQNDPYKIDLISDLEDGTVTYYQQGELIDLCRGSHVDTVKQLKNFKLLKHSGAYWKGGAGDKMLQRIYGICFPIVEELEGHLHLLEEAKKRDHKELGRGLGLFMMNEFAPGMPLFLSDGVTTRSLLGNFWYKKHTKENYQFIKTSIMVSKELWEMSGHWENYKENMYTAMVDDREFAIKPMNCPGSLLVFKDRLHSYKDLPLYMGELGQVHRHETSGALNGLFHVRTLTQDDAHIFIRPDQIENEVVQLIQFIDRVYSMFGLSYHIELSTRPEKKYIRDLAIREQGGEALADTCVCARKGYKVNPEDEASYGPKLDFHIKDSLGREWQCGTIQLSMNPPEQFDLTYVEKDGSRVHPVMLRRVIFGSIERFIGILIEYLVGYFPVWLTPQQVSVVPVRYEEHLGYTNEVHERLCALDFRSKLDARNEKLGYRIRKAQLSKIPYQLVIGDGEVENRGVTPRRAQSRESIMMSLDDFIAMVEEAVKEEKL